MFKFKKIVVLIIAIVLIVGISMQVKATDDPIDVSNLLSSNTTGDQNESNTTSNSLYQNSISTNTTNTAGGSVVQPDTNKTEGSSENNLPQTGVTEDITVMFFIIVCAISAIYAYKKIRDYKN